VSARNFPYRSRQDPGPRNALGRVVFWGVCQAHASDRLLFLTAQWQLVAQTTAGNITLTTHLPHLSPVAPTSVRERVDGKGW